MAAPVAMSALTMDADKLSFEYAIAAADAISAFTIELERASFE